jgi:hypothetical protein
MGAMRAIRRYLYVALDFWPFRPFLLLRFAYCWLLPAKRPLRPRILR